MCVKDFTTMLCGLALIGGVTLVAAQPVPDITPQWLHVLERSTSSRDSMTAPEHRAWARLSGGDTVLATRIDTGSLLLRRFAPDGSLVRSQRVAAAGFGNDSPVIVVQADPLGGGFALLAGSGPYCGLQRFDADLRRVWIVTLPGESPGGGACSRLEFLTDGSLLAMRSRNLARIAADGTVVWVVNNGDDGRYFWASNFLVDSNSVIWVAGQGDLLGSGGNEAAVLRFTLDGARLPADTFLCTTCVASRATDLAGLPDGDIIVSGQSGSNQPGFVARYAGDGQRRFLTDATAGIGYAQVAVDSAGSIHVLATTNNEPSHVHRLDGTNGSVLWTASGSGVVGLDSGVAVTRTIGAAQTIVSIDLAGNERWSRPIAGNATATVSRGAWHGARIEWLVQGDLVATASCGIAPRLVSLDLTGENGMTLHACAMPAEDRIVALDAREDHGMLATTPQRLIAYAPSGALRWQAERCPACPPGAGFTRWVTAVLRNDGGAWAVEAVQDTSDLFSPWSKSLQHIGNDGLTLATIPLGNEIESFAQLRLLVAGDDSVVVLQSRSTPESTAVIGWHIDAGGHVLGVNELAVPDQHSDFEIRSARRLADGGALYVTQGMPICMVGCPPFHVEIVRTQATGQLGWRHTFAQDLDVEVALGDDGTATAVFGLAPTGAMHRRTIAADGMAGVDQALPGVPIASWVWALSPIVQERQLMLSTSFDDHEGRLLDAAGASVATRALYSGYPPILATSHHGHLLTEMRIITNDAELLDPATLQTRAAFHLPSSALATDPNLPRQWRMLDDGSTYAAAMVLSGHGVRQLAVARFMVPGSPAADLVFHDGFD